MKQEIAEKWAEALESGEFKQGRNSLGKGYGSYCCLGVLCEIAVGDGIIPPPVVIDGEKVYVGENATLPNEVKDWAGMHSRDGSRQGNEGNPLWKLNDRNGANFKDIAKVVRNEWATL